MVISRDGKVYIVTEGHDWFWKSFAEKTWEASTFKIFDKFLDKDKTFVDIGAWIGPTTLYAADKARTVYSFEPDPVAYRALTQNLALNNIKNVIPYPVAVAARWGGIDFGPKIQYGDSMSSVLWAKRGAAQVPSISLEAVVMDLQPSFIKIDIEGGERTIFDNALLALTECKPTIHLSLHTPWFLKHPEDFKKSIMESLEMYPYVYDEELNPIRLEDAFDVNKFNSVVLTFKKI